MHRKKKPERYCSFWRQTANIRRVTKMSGLYFEQMLSYDETYRAGYGEYGMFLLRTGQQKASQTLWSEYESKEAMLDDTDSRNLELWKTEMIGSEENQ